MPDSGAQSGLLCRLGRQRPRACGPHAGGLQNQRAPRSQGPEQRLGAHVSQGASKKKQGHQRETDSKPGGESHVDRLSQALIPPVPALPACSDLGSLIDPWSPFLGMGSDSLEVASLEFNVHTSSLRRC